MNDVSSGKEEYPIGNPPSANRETIKSKKDVNPLLSVEPEYSQLPNSFDVNNRIADGFELLRKETQDKGVEIGGVIFKDAKGEIKLQINPTSELHTKGMMISGFPILDEGNVEPELRRVQRYEEHPDKEYSRFAKQLYQVYFVDSNTAQKYRHFFEKLVQEGKEIIIDGTPIAPIHTHPSGHLPSRGDFAHVGWLSPKVPEIVVTSDWAYFLIPTKQTPDFLEDPSGQFKLSDFKAMEQQEYEKETSVVDHLIASSRKAGQQAEREATNAVRLKMLTDNCTRYNVGFYTLKKGESVAKRIV